MGKKKSNKKRKLRTPDKKQLQETGSVLADMGAFMTRGLASFAMFIVLICIISQGIKTATQGPPGGSAYSQASVFPEALGLGGVGQPAAPVADKEPPSTPTVPAPKTDPPAKVEQITAGTYTELIPDGRGNYRSEQLDAAKLRAELATGKYKYVIRMNGDRGNDRGALSSAQEKAICAEYKVEYLTWKHESRFNAHVGYEEGAGVGYFDSYAKAYEYLMQGGVLIHCRWNFHRTGMIVGAWLAAHGWSWAEIVEHNKWEDYITGQKSPDGVLSEKDKRYIETVTGQLQS